MNTGRAPWLSKQNFKLIKETWSCWLGRAHGSEEVWLAVGPRIAKDKTWPIGRVYADGEKSIRELSTSRSLTSLGIYVKDRIWLSFVREAE